MHVEKLVIGWQIWRFSFIRSSSVIWPFPMVAIADERNFEFLNPIIMK
jgi:hypothetical protein